MLQSLIGEPKQLSISNSRLVKCTDLAADAGSVGIDVTLGGLGE